MYLDLMLLPREGLGADEHTRDIRVVVQNMGVPVAQKTVLSIQVGDWSSPKIPPASWVAIPSSAVGAHCDGRPNVALKDGSAASRLTGLDSGG